ncbi:MAG: hypothetical protein ACRET1_02675, partial [Burkholderiales bacterium]
VTVSVLHAVALLFGSNNHSTIDKQFMFLAQIYQISDTLMNFDARSRLTAASRPAVWAMTYACVLAAQTK